MLSYLQEKELSKLCLDTYNLLNKTISINPSFNTILPLLSNKQFSSNNLKITQILNCNLNNKKIKCFLTCIMIKYCPDEIFSEKKEVEEQLIEKSGEMLQLYLNFLEDCLNEKLQKDFINELQNYIEIFEAWRNNDKKKLIVVLASSHHDLCLTADYIKNKNNENEQEILDGIEQQKKTLEKAIYKLGGNEAINSLIDGSFWLELMSPEFKKSIEENLKNAFFNKLNDELQLDKKPFMTIKCLQEIKELLYKCVPSREDLQTKWNKNIHIEVLNQELTIEKRTLIIKDCLNKFKDIILELESPERNEETKKYEIDDVVDGIKFCYEKISLIFADIQQLKKNILNNT